MKHESGSDDHDLQSSIVTSTMESEYAALSLALRAFIPMYEVVKTVVRVLHYLRKQQVKFLIAVVHEDNQGSVYLLT